MGAGKMSQKSNDTKNIYLLHVWHKNVEYKFSGPCVSGCILSQKKSTGGYCAILNSQNSQGAEVACWTYWVCSIVYNTLYNWFTKCSEIKRCCAHNQIVQSTVGAAYFAPKVELTIGTCLSIANSA